MFRAWYYRRKKISICAAKIEEQAKSRKSERASTKKKPWINPGFLD
jgi:hypothetical protein